MDKISLNVRHLVASISLHQLSYSWKFFTETHMTKSNRNPDLSPESKASFHRQLAIQHAHTAHRLVQQRYVSDAKPIFVDKGR